ncbi:SIS domain-containing protein [Planomonospora sp. ID82291]|uniref:SIS domain-containing protein n=1 Tax=Planomonospora sp. ID82291 TaxID=2738136 RepID=UPI0018C39424|nr:SIS domain-containing protein [Planomonospora sp. ID82291]MBG0818701.1 SIS domain-containing protein [Planomonospora sp. ID82291]
MENSPYTLQEMLAQVGALAADVRALAGPAAEQVEALLGAPGWAQASQVYLTGDGDSFHAALAAELAFESLAGVTCEPLSALRFLRYGASWERPPALAPGSVVIGISASGRTERVVQALERAREHGALTVALTATPHSALTRAAGQALVLTPAGAGRSPGIRTYQASLLGLALLAIGLGRRRGRYPAAHADLLHAEIRALADAIEATAAAVKDPCAELAARIAHTPVMIMLGSGPGFGTACFAAAKLVEAAGVLAVGQDLEEWEQVEALAYPRDMPTVVIAPPGRCHDRAHAVATAARSFGRRVIAVAEAGDQELAEAAEVVLPVCGRVREEWSPLLFHVFAGYLACFVAGRLGRLPFATNRR